MKISFLTSCMNRCNNLKKTYLENIANSKPTKNIKVEFVLLNYNSKDDLDEWVNNNLLNADIDFKYLQTKRPKYFDMSNAKNILGKHASGDILCWLDADNYTYDGFVTFLADNFDKNKNLVFQVSWSKKTSGMCGRIACTKKNFQKVGGYNEEFTGWGYEELDFCQRLKSFNCILREIPLRYLGKEENDEKERMENYAPNIIKRMPNNHPLSHMQYVSNFKNFNLSKKNIAHGNIIANIKKDWGKL